MHEQQQKSDKKNVLLIFTKMQTFKKFTTIQQQWLKVKKYVESLWLCFVCVKKKRRSWGLIVAWANK